jgi:hypothetical protein
MVVLMSEFPEGLSLDSGIASATFVSNKALRYTVSSIITPFCVSGGGCFDLLGL